METFKTELGTKVHDISEKIIKMNQIYYSSIERLGINTEAQIVFRGFIALLGEEQLINQHLKFSKWTDLITEEHRGLNYNIKNYLIDPSRINECLTKICEDPVSEVSIPKFEKILKYYTDNIVNYTNFISNKEYILPSIFYQWINVFTTIINVLNYLYNSGVYENLRDKSQIKIKEMLAHKKEEKRLKTQDLLDHIGVMSQLKKSINTISEDNTHNIKRSIIIPKRSRSSIKTNHSALLNDSTKIKLPKIRKSETQKNQTSKTQTRTSFSGLPLPTLPNISEAETKNKTNNAQVVSGLLAQKMKDYLDDMSSEDYENVDVQNTLSSEQYKNKKYHFGKHFERQECQIW